MSYGRTVQRHITRDEGYLSFPASAIVSIFAKDALKTDEGEYWEAEVHLVGCISVLLRQVYNIVVFLFLLQGCIAAASYCKPVSCYYGFSVNVFHCKLVA